MAEIVTNRDLYLAITQLIAQNEKTARPLDEYLRALWVIGWRYEDQPSLSPDEFFGVLAEAFTGHPESASFLIAVTAEVYAWDFADAPGYAGWENRIIRQVTDLIEMAEAGQLADKMRYFGIDSPRGSRWYNFTTCAFLDRALAGGFGDRDWDEEPESEVEPLTEITWEQFRDFLGAGQTYE